MMDTKKHNKCQILPISFIGSPLNEANTVPVNISMHDNNSSPNSLFAGSYDIFHKVNSIKKKREAFASK